MAVDDRDDVRSSVSGEPSVVPENFGFDEDGDAWIDRIRESESGESLGRIGDYEVLAEAGRGAQGIVYRARRAGTKVDAALKRLAAGVFATASMRRRFDREIEAASALDHPNIVRILGIDEADGQRVLAMEWVDGKPITQWAAPTDHRPPALPRLIDVFLKVCDAVHHAHQRGVIHRDLKPSNILVETRGEPHVVDFGLAKLLDTNEPGDVPVTRTGQFVGTPAYASPEQLDGGNSFDVRTDVYSLGVVLYHLVAGRLPYPASVSLTEMARLVREAEPVAPSAVSGRGDRTLDAVVLKCIAKPQSARYQSVEALSDDLRRYLRGEAVRARPCGRVERIKRVCRQNPVAVSLMIAVFSGLAVGLVHLYRLSGKLLEQTALDSAAMHADMLDRMNALYSSLVATPMQEYGVDVTHDFAGKSGAVPLPASFTIVLGEDMRDSEYGMQVRLYSDHPFRSRPDGGARDTFECDALAQLRENPDQAVYRFEDYDGRYSLRHATARRMEASCVQCHNNHPNSTKRDWKVGDVRGVLEIIHPLDRDVARTQEALRGTFLLIGGISGTIFVIAAAVVVVGNVRRRQRMAAAASM